MASSPKILKTSHHARSISLPSGPHPLFPQLDEHLCRLNSSEGTSSSSSISDKLIGLTSLFDCLENLLLLPLSQQVLLQPQNWRLVDEAADGYLMLLDVCSVAKDALLQTKERVQELQSIIRRRGSGEVWSANEVGEYLASRKKEKKAIYKSLRDLKNMDNKCNSSASYKQDETAASVDLLREVEAATLAAFKSLLFFIAGPKEQSKARRWSLVSRVMQSKRVAGKTETAEMSELEMVDTALSSRVCGKTSKSLNVHNLLGKLVLNFQDVEGELECLFRRLIKTRVSLLNILNH